MLLEELAVGGGSSKGGLKGKLWWGEWRAPVLKDGLEGGQEGCGGGG